MNLYQNPHEERDPTNRGEVLSTYVPMKGVICDEDEKNYDDVINVNPHFQSNNMPNMNPDRDVYDDITNVNPDFSPNSYENMRSIKMDYSTEKLL
ncbi:hypothetical protein LOD99_7694 [Oopsacas minuta]|uniref:Plasmodium falciparum erythrocyte membrane protein 1 acidic terminal segment domain-containing protein n=1 Tax=Oopsacas minuta TaxID=111878 RepID=A0AAV7JQ13_9METZ|nr:hypothetical protein LOD99_7694 [Oopsacas minuta]